MRYIPPMITRKPKGAILRAGDEAFRILAVSDHAPAAIRFCDGDGGEIIIEAPPILPKRKGRPRLPQAA